MLTSQLACDSVAHAGFATSLTIVLFINIFEALHNIIVAYLSTKSKLTDINRTLCSTKPVAHIVSDTYTELHHYKCYGLASVQTSKRAFCAFTWAHHYYARSLGRRLRRAHALDVIDLNLLDRKTKVTWRQCGRWARALDTSAACMVNAFYFVYARCTAELLNRSWRGDLRLAIRARTHSNTFALVVKFWVLIFHPRRSEIGAITGARMLLQSADVWRSYIIIAHRRHRHRRPSAAGIMPLATDLARVWFLFFGFARRCALVEACGAIFIDAHTHVLKVLTTRPENAI